MDLRLHVGYYTENCPKAEGRGEKIMSNEKLLTLDGICKYFRVSGGMLKAVDNVTFDIYKAETLVLLASPAAESQLLACGNGYL